MKKKTTQYLEKVVDIEYVGEVTVRYKEVVSRFPEQHYECHGQKVISEDELEIDLIDVKREVLGNEISILPLLTQNQKKEIIKML